MKKIHIKILLLVFSFQHLFCQWDGNPAKVNNVMMVSDEADSAIAAWRS